MLKSLLLAVALMGVGVVPVSAHNFENPYAVNVDGR